jgi:selenocysteine lyase/cysteine desulfurase
MQKLGNQSALFDLDSNHHYLNGAFMAPQLKKVSQVGINALIKKSNPQLISGEDFFNTTEEIRTEYSKLINNTNPNRVVLIPSVSYGMANVARNIDTSGKKIIIAGEQFPSNVYPWMSLAEEQGGDVQIIEPPGEKERRGESWNKKILEAINPKTAAVALSHIHWADGTKFDLEAIRERTEQNGALLIIDGTQSVGALPFDIAKIKPDALICAGYKWLLGAYGLGLAYYGEYFDKGVPFEENWINRLHSEDFAGLVDYESKYQPGALRYEVGEHSNFILAPMLLEAIRQINEWQPDRIQAYCKDLVSDSIRSLRNVGYWIEDEEWRANHLFGIRHDSVDIEKIKKELGEKSISVSYRGTAIRVSPYVHNTKDQMELLTETLIKVANA